MPLLFPTYSTISTTFCSQSPLLQLLRQTSTAEKPMSYSSSNRFPIWSVLEDARVKAEKLGDAAAKDFDKASAKAQAKAGNIELYSPKYYAACTFGGLMACAQGAFKYGGYEFFKKFYSDLAGEGTAKQWKTTLYLTASASAEFIADIALCPFEAVKVRMQTTIPHFATGTMSGISTITSSEGVAGLYKGLYPLWGRQIPYTMMKFASFETIVEMIYNYLPGTKNDYGKAAQTSVSFAGGYAAGILCAIVSHPADVMVSKLNANRKAGEAFGAAMGRIYGEIGFGGLWNGLPVRIVMIGKHARPLNCFITNFPACRVPGTWHALLQEL
ncbi:MAG: hypothetical protein M1814_000182 [Vezdaea aestivalis]|nr:MAG: hypothetical protein M1814_000182 [Vezdaea aestivalis]